MRLPSLSFPWRVLCLTLAVELEDEPYFCRKEPEPHMLTLTTPNDDPTMLDLARNPGVVALIGFSPRPDRSSHGVAKYLLSHDVNVYLVNPMYAGQQSLDKTILGSLAEVPEPIHIVDVFRRADSVMPIVDDAIAAKADAIWFQLDIINEDAFVRAREAGMNVIVDRCLAVEHRKAIIRG